MHNTLGIIIYLSVIYLLAYNTIYLTRVQKIAISTFQLIKINLVSSFYGLFLPGSISSSAVRWYKLSKFGNKVDSVAVVLFGRFLETFMLIYIGIIFLLPSLIVQEKYQFVLITVFALSLLILSYVLLLYPPSLIFFEKTLKLFPFPALIKNFLSKFFESMHKFQKLTLKENIKILSLLFCYHLITVLTFYLFARSLNINISFSDIAWIRSATVLLSMFPVSFAGLGIREGSLIFILGIYKIPPGEAIAYSFLLFSLTILMSISGGLIELSDFLSVKNARYQSKETITSIEAIKNMTPVS
ncbi:MAG: UPF0104 family protein [Ignavibacteriales bacterium]|nr:MAG: UPF0104 family protein [Ignavibacteriales bacterium]